MRYLLNLLIWLDIGANVIIFAGSPYETISSRAGKRRDKGERWACIFCKWLDKLDPQHCKTAQVNDYGKTANNWWRVKIWRWAVPVFPLELVTGRLQRYVDGPDGWRRRFALALDADKLEPYDPGHIRK